MQENKNAHSEMISPQRPSEAVCRAMQVRSFLRCMVQQSSQSIDCLSKVTKGGDVTIVPICFFKDCKSRTKEDTNAEFVPVVKPWVEPERCKSLCGRIPSSYQ